MKDNQTVSAQAWIVMDFAKSAYIRGVNVQEKREIASLTKMYTLYSCLTLNKLLKINPETASIKIFQNSIAGTSAGLQSGRFIHLMDLYYGLMLPSGNDAAYLLACYYGSWIISKDNSTALIRWYKKQDLSDSLSHLNLFCKKFVQFMNKIIVKEELNHKNTNFENPHGLSDKHQVSTVWELAEAAMLFMKNPLFAKISACRNHRGSYVGCQEGFQWSNLNVLLQQGHVGIKTGFTTTAGGCLASVAPVKIGRFQMQYLLIVVLGSESSTTRFQDVSLIIKHHLAYLTSMKF